MTISELCNQVLTYLQMINISNKNKVYTPSGSLSNGGNVHSYTKSGVKRGVKKNTVENLSVSHIVKTNQSISAVYTAQVTNDRISSDWNTFKNTYISKMLNINETISLSSMFVFIYLVRCFMDARFVLFMDVYNKNRVWLYNTSTSVDYNISGYIAPTDFVDFSGVTTLSNIISVFADEVSSKRNMQVLKSTSYESVAVV